MCSYYQQEDHLGRRGPEIHLSSRSPREVIHDRWLAVGPTQTRCGDSSFPTLADPCSTIHAPESLVIAPGALLLGVGTTLPWI